MRAKEFIFESDWQDVQQKNPDSTVKAAYERQVAATIRRYCKPFLANNRAALTAGDFLYRGISKSNNAGFAISGKVRTDREPRDTIRRWHDTLDLFFNRQFGTRYRSSSLFCSTNFNEAAGYGNVYVIFPKGDYKICYSDVIEDVTVDLAGGIDMSRDISPQVENILMSIPASAYAEAANKHGLDTITDFGSFKNMFDDFTLYSAPDPDDRFSSFLADFILPNLRYKETVVYSDTNGHEAMVSCRGYYGLRVNSGDTEYLHSVINLILK